MQIKFENAKLSELDQIMAIENAGFNKGEAATKEAMRQRIKDYPDTFIVALAGNRVAGYIVGPAYNKRYLDDDLYQESHPNRKADPYQAVLSLAVAPALQGQGIASQLLTQLK